MKVKTFRKPAQDGGLEVPCFTVEDRDYIIPGERRTRRYERKAVEMRQRALDKLRQS